MFLNYNAKIRPLFEKRKRKSNYFCKICCKTYYLSEKRLTSIIFAHSNFYEVRNRNRTHLK
nr:MAG TPA: NUDIX domain protein [Caudoviricetes sp.]DAG41791.1 MAG TPA: NUDIX domain protein [Caudoviricetes sp.]